MSESHEKPKRRSIALYVWLGLCVLMLIAFLTMYLFTDSSLHISPETTYITEPLTPDGTRVDYLRAIEERAYPPQMQTDDNGCRILTRALGPPPLVVQVGEQEQYYEKLGIPLNNAPSMVCVNEINFMIDYLCANRDIHEQWKEKYIEYQKENGPDGIPESNWDYSCELGLVLFLISKPEIAGPELSNAWQQQVYPVLDVLAETVRKPVFMPPYVFLQDTSYETMRIAPLERELYQNFRSSLLYRAIRRVDESDIDGAIDDIITSLRLGRYMTKRGGMLNYNTGISLEGIAYAVGLNKNPDAPPSAEQIKRYLREFDALPEPRSIKDALNEDRLEHLNEIQHLIDSPRRQNDIATHMGGNTTVTGRFCGALGYDWSIVIKRYNQLYDALLRMFR